MSVVPSFSVGDRIEYYPAQHTGYTRTGTVVAITDGGRWLSVRDLNGSTVPVPARVAALVGPEVEIATKVDTSPDSRRLDALDDGTNRLIQIDRVQSLNGREGWILREWIPGKNVVSYEGRTLRAVIDAAYPLAAANTADDYTIRQENATLRREIGHVNDRLRLLDLKEQRRTDATLNAADVAIDAYRRAVTICVQRGVTDDSMTKAHAAILALILK